jgi:hypothetical protein
MLLGWAAINLAVSALSAQSPQLRNVGRVDCFFTNTKIEKLDIRPAYYFRFILYRGTIYCRVSLLRLEMERDAAYVPVRVNKA